MADKALIDFSGSQITFAGRLFKGDAAKELKDVVGHEVQSLAHQGERLVKAQIRTANGTGFTREHVTVVSAAPNALYASVRLPSEGDLPLRVYPPLGSNGKPNPRAGASIHGSSRYPARRVPFIVLAILESGRYGGRHVSRSRRTSRGFTTRTRWQHSATRRQPAQFFFRRTTRALSAKTPAIRDAIIARFSD